MGPILRPSQRSAGTCIRNKGCTILRTIRHIRNTKGHTILQHRKDHTIHGICMECMPMSSSSMDCCTMGCNACSSTMNFLCCMGYSTTMGQCCSSSRMGYILHSRLCFPFPCHTICWQTCCPGSSRCLSSRRKDICLRSWFSQPKRPFLSSTPLFLSLI